MIHLYQYSKCGTCRKSKKYFDDHGIKYKEIDITLTPPSKKVLKLAIKKYGIKKIFNTSGVEYREKKIKDKIKNITEKKAIDILAKNGRLVKRPIAYEDNKITLGFNEEEFSNWVS